MNLLADEIAHIFSTRKIPSENLSSQLSGTASIHIERNRTIADLNNLFGAMQEIYSAIINHCIQTHAYYLSLRGLGEDDLDRYYTAENRYRQLQLAELGVKRIAINGHGVMEIAGLDAIVKHIAETVTALSQSPNKRANSNVALEEKLFELNQLRTKMGISTEAIKRIESAQNEIIRLSKT